MSVIWQTAIRRVPMWRTGTMAAYGRIFEPYAPKWDYDQYGQRSRVPLWDIYNGCILWLPPKDEINPAALEGSGRQYDPPEAFARPVLCVEVDVKGPTSGQVYYATMGAKSDSGGPEAFLRSCRPDHISPWVNLPWVDTVLPIVRSDTCHDYPTALTLEHDTWRTNTSAMPKDAAILAGYGIYAIDYKELRCYGVRPDDLPQKIGKLADGADFKNFQWRYRLDEPSMRIVNHILGLRQLPWITSGTGMWNHFIERVGIGTPEQLEKLRKVQHFAKVAESVPPEQRPRLYKYFPGQGQWDEPNI